MHTHTPHTHTRFRACSRGHDGHTLTGAAALSSTPRPSATGMAGNQAGSELRRGVGMGKQGLTKGRGGLRRERRKGLLGSFRSLHWGPLQGQAWAALGRLVSGHGEPGDGLQHGSRRSVKCQAHTGIQSQQRLADRVGRAGTPALLPTGVLFFFNFFIWLCQVLAVALEVFALPCGLRGLFSCRMWDLVP